MAVLLVRHAAAGDRDAWHGDDFDRPLSKKGRRQAEGLVEVLAGFPIKAIVSSPSVRCVQTVEPIARDRGLEIYLDNRLFEGADTSDVLDLIAELGDGVVLGTHGDVIPDVVDHLVRHRGVELEGEPGWSKASTWVLDLDGHGEVTTARYVPPPTV